MTRLGSKYAFCSLCDCTLLEVVQGGAVMIIAVFAMADGNKLSNAGQLEVDFCFLRVEIFFSCGH